MYHYTDEQLASMKKVEASREKRYEELFPRMTADEKDAVLKAKTRAIKFCTNLPRFCKANRERSV